VCRRDWIAGTEAFQKPAMRGKQISPKISLSFSRLSNSQNYNIDCQLGKQAVAGPQGKSIFEFGQMSRDVSAAGRPEMPGA
jgi:hypothetical protein